ncbi:hypothetical protein RB195_005807 [Necator americanus]|uniref:Uncharacterized protein n=1 Tax=Necator americanus TaxID=51031 RepID=A0ABR1BSR8_NECAM
MGLTPRFEMLDLIVLEKKGQPLLLRRFLNLESKHHQRNDEIVLLPPFHHLHQHSRIAGQLSYPTAAVEEREFVTSREQPAIAIAPPPAPIVEPVVEAAPVVAPAQYAPTPVVASAPIVAPPPVVAPAPAFPTSTTINHALNFAKSYSKETGHTSDTAVIYEGGHFPFGHLPANRIFGDMHVDGPFRARKKLATKKAVLARINLEKKS